MYLVKNRFLYGLTLLLMALSMAGCKKYATQPDVGQAAYLRVFNNIPFTVTLVNQNQPVPFFTLLIDPQVDGKGIPAGAKITGDFLGYRNLFNPSYASAEGNSLNSPYDTSIKYNINNEYPGLTHVLTAPSIGGFDLSAWAQVPSGRHRIQFVVRPENNIAFSSLSDSIRRRVLIDTTIDLQQGEVYTMEALLLDVDANRFGIYLRQEDFMKQSFDANKNYISFFNLSSNTSTFSNLPQSPSSAYFRDTMNVFYSYYTFQDAGPLTGGSPFNPPLGYSNNFIASLTGRMAARAQYYPLPLLPISYFYDLQGNLRSQADTTYYNGTSAYFLGPTTPYLQFNWLSAGNNVIPVYNPQNIASNGTMVFTMTCNIDPALINIGNRINYNNNGQSVNGESMANLNMLAQSGTQTYIYPAVYIVELVNTLAYVMQVQRKL